MQDVRFKQFKIRYFILTYIVLTILTIVAVVSIGASQFVSEVLQLILSTALMAYILWQVRAKDIPFNFASLNEAMTPKRWAKYVGVTIATKLYAQLLVAFFGLVLVILLFDFIQILFKLIGEIPIVTAEMSISHYVVTFITICILAPIWEELFFRGIVLRRLLMKWHAPASIVVSSIIFGLFHLNPSQVLYAGILGLLLGYAYLRTGNIFVPMVLHGVANGVSFIFIVQFGGQMGNGIVPEFMDIDKEVLIQSMVYLGIGSLIFTIVLLIFGIKNYPHIKAIRKIEQTTVEESASGSGLAMNNETDNMEVK